jgi:DNA phosphorothioation-dependent restriction protein DptG
MGLFHPASSQFQDHFHYLYAKINAMSILEMKQEIKSQIDKIEDKKLLEEIQSLLHRDDADIPDWHKKILEERLKEDRDGTTEWLDWEEVKKDL